MTANVGKIPIGSHLADRSSLNVLLTLMANAPQFSREWGVTENHRTWLAHLACYTLERNRLEIHTQIKTALTGTSP